MSDALSLLAKRLYFDSIKNKDQVLVLLFSVILILLSKFLFDFYRQLEIKAFFKHIGILLINRALNIDEKVRKGIADMRKEVHKAKATSIQPVYDSLPTLTEAQIRERIRQVQEIDSVREKIAKEGGNYYYDVKDTHKDFVCSIASQFLYTNIMHFDACKGSQLLENELINFFGELLNAPSTFVGNSTFGGTESILLSMLAYRELGYKRGIKDPEIVMFESGHVAFCKAAFYFKIKVTRVRVSEETGLGSVDELLAHTNENTVVIVLSGGTYAHGAVDQVQEVSDRIMDTDILIHVDSCLGGFMSSCSALRKDGKIPPIDFRVAKVSTISIDPHKYGESPKGSSIVLFRNEELKKMSIFIYKDWTGGLYATPGIPGSRGCAPLVGAWVSLVKNGKQGILSTYDLICKTRESLLRDLRSIPEIRVIGNPISCVVSFTTHKRSGISLFDLHDFLTDAKWHLSMMQKPYCLHITITKNNVETLRTLKDELVSIIQKCRSNPNKGKNSVYSVLYGSLVKLPDESMIEDTLKTSVVEINRLKIN